MKFALIGDDPAALELVRAIAASPVDHLATASLLAATALEVKSCAPGVRITAGWDELLADPGIDGVVVAGAQAETLEAAKQLAAAGKSLLIVPQAMQGSTFYYELSLIRDDTGVLLFPVLPARVDREVVALRHALGELQIGRLQYLELTRETPATAQGDGRSRMTSAEIDDALLPDVDLLRHIGGDYNQVTALHFGSDEHGVANAAVTLSGNHCPEAVWKIRRAHEQPLWELKLIGEQGTAVLTCDAAGQFHSSIAPRRIDAAVPQAQDRGAAILARFKAVRAVDREACEWSDLVRNMEIVEATHRSIRRRRTIDLHFETTSERSLFKTQMTAIGCGVLTFTLFAVISLLIATPLLDMRDRKQVEAERAGAVIVDSDFEPASSTLSPSGRVHLEAVAGKMRADRFEVLVARVPGNSELNVARRNSVVEELSRHSAPNADSRTVVAEIQGQWLAKVLRIARILVFAPLFLFLALQVLLLLTRPSAN